MSTLPSPQKADTSGFGLLDFHPAEVLQSRAAVVWGRPLICVIATPPSKKRKNPAWSLLHNMFQLARGGPAHLGTLTWLGAGPAPGGTLPELFQSCSWAVPELLRRLLGTMCSSHS